MTTASPAPAVSTATLSRLYAARFAFAAAWGLVVLAAASEINPFVGGLLVLYPVYDLIALAADARSFESSTSRPALVFNIFASAAAALGIAAAATSGVPAVLRVWGAWAIIAGVAQLVVGLRRRGHGGQLPMLLSGAISVLAGAGFVTMASQDDPSLRGVGGYALLGGAFFLMSSIMLRRRDASLRSVA